MNQIMFLFAPDRGFFLLVHLFEKHLEVTVHHTLELNHPVHARNNDLTREHTDLDQILGKVPGSEPVFLGLQICHVFR